MKFKEIKLTDKQKFIIDEAGGYGAIIANSYTLQCFLQSWGFNARDDEDILAVLESCIVEEIKYKNRRPVLQRLFGKYISESRKTFMRRLREAGGNI